MLTAFVVLALAVYLLPTIMGALLGVPKLWAILLVNVFLGWTIAGWAVALMWVMQRTGLIGQPVMLRDRDPRYLPPYALKSR
jgi:hypothetical protein